MIFLKKLQINNFLSHEKTEIIFGQNEKILLDGSSGAGKSTIFDAIIWALYGQGRTDNRSLVRKGTKRGSVSLELTQESTQGEETKSITITRSITSAGKHTLEVIVDGKAHELYNIRDLQNWIDKELIGASYLLFVNSVAYVQGNAESFVAQTAPKRKELLLEIVKAEDYDKYYENARTALSKLDNDKNRVYGQITELEAFLGVLKGRIDIKDTHIKDITEYSIKLKDIDPKKKVLEEQKAGYTAIEQTVLVVRSAMEKTVSDKYFLENGLKDKQGKIARKPILIKALENSVEYQTDIKNLTETLNVSRNKLSIASEQETQRNLVLNRKPVIHDSYYQDVQRLNARIEKILAKPVCPSGTQCPYSGDHTKEIEDLKTQIKECEEIMDKESSALVAWTEESSKLPPAIDIGSIMKEIGNTETSLKAKETELSMLVSMQKDLDIISEIEKEIPPLEEEISKKATDIEKYKQDIEQIEATTNTLEQARVTQDLRNIETEERNIQEKITRATAGLENIEKDENEFRMTELRVKFLRGEDLVLIEEATRKVTMVKEAFSRHGVETIICDYILPLLEDKINEILSKLSDFSIRLDTQRKSADGESTIEGLFILLYNEQGEELPYESYSGGEKIRITFAITEAFASLGQKKIGWRLIDEAVLALDPNSLESFLEVIETLLGDFDQILFISHIQEVKDMFEKRINIEKHNGISTIKK